MSEFINPLRVVDIALVWLLIETVIRYLRQRSTDPGQSPRGLLANALSGLMLLMALRSILSGWETAWFLVFMTAAGLAHLLDIWGRSGRRGR